VGTVWVVDLVNLFEIPKVDIRWVDGFTALGFQAKVWVRDTVWRNSLQMVIRARDEIDQ
jgi:hypothetical protein